MKLFNFDNAKTRKGEQLGYSTAILYLLPSDTSGIIDTCTHATAHCKALCLATAGMAGIFPNIIASRKKKTAWLAKNPETFWAKIDREVLNHENLCYRNTKRLKRKLKPCVRINGTSDIWNTDMQTIMYRYPDVQFYDYTKDFERIVDWHMDKMPMNYHLTFSHSERNLEESKWCLANGINVAVVFENDGSLPSSWNGYEVIDGDKSDLRFLDARLPYPNALYVCHGVVIGLRAKGKAKKATAKVNGFVNPTKSVFRGVAWSNPIDGEEDEEQNNLNRYE
jgi:hypothetical protein